MTATKRISSLDFNGFQALSMVLENLASEPGGPNSAGRIYYNSATHLVGVCYSAGSPGSWMYFSTVTYTNENAQDTIADAFAAGSHSGISVVYDDTNNKFSLTVGNITSAMITDGTITDVDINAANKDGSVGTASMRTLGTGAQQAMPGDTRLDTIAQPTGSVNLNGQKVTGAADGTATTDYATFGQLSAILEGKKWKSDPVDAATTAALATVTYSSSAGTLTATANGALAAQDGVTLTAGKSLLVKNQASTFQDGAYLVTQVGDGSTPFILTRRADSNSAGELSGGATYYVTGGTSQGGDIYTQTATLADLTAAAQTWAKTGDTNVVYTADGVTIQLSGTQFSIPNGGIANAQIAAAAAVAYSKLALTASIVNADIAAAAAIARSKIAAPFSTTIGDGASISIAVAHNLGSKFVQVGIFRTASPYDEVDCYYERTDTNTITFKPDVAPASGEYTVFISL